MQGIGEGGISKMRKDEKGRGKEACGKSWLGMSMKFQSLRNENGSV